MPARPHYHLITRVVVIAAVVALLPLTLGFVLIQHSAKTRLSDAAGTSFASLADQAAAAVDAAFAREFELLGAVARSPSVVESLRTDASESSILPVASSLYLELVVLNLEGAVVAASAPDIVAESYAKDEGFQKTVQRTQGRIESSDGWAGIGEDPGLLTLYRSVREPGSRNRLGFVRAEIDTERIFVAVSNLRIGKTGHGCIYDLESGRVLAGRAAACASDGGYARYEDAERALRQGRRYFLANVTGPSGFDRADALLVAQARPELARILPELDWVVAVEQSLAETHAPLEPMSRELILYFLGMGVLVVLLAAYVSFKLERPLAEDAVHLHEDVGEPAR